MRSILNVDPVQLSTTLRAANTVTSRDPADVFRNEGPVDPDEIRSKFDDYIRNDSGLTTDEVQQSAGLLTQGFDATRKIVLNTIARSGQEFSMDSKIGIARHDNTVDVMATVALQDTFVAREFMALSSQTDSPFQIDSEGNSIVFEHGFYQAPAIDNGCPAVLTRNNMIAPIFSKFVKWSGEVAVRSSYRTNPDSKFIY